MFDRIKTVSRAHFMVLLTVLLVGSFAGAADTIILHNGKKKKGEVLRMDRRSVTIQVDEYFRMKLYRAHVKEIITNRWTPFDSDPNAVSFVYDPTADKEENRAPKAQELNLQQFQVPDAVLITQSGFKPKSTPGGLSDGKTIGIDGRPLSKHRIYADDSGYFAKKYRNGMLRTTPGDQQERMAGLRYIAGLVSTVRHLNDDLKTGIMLEGRGRTRETLLDAHDEFKTEALKYQKKYGREALKERELPLVQWIAQIDSAVRTYRLCASFIGYEDKMGVRDRIDLEGGKTERGKLLRWRLKVAIVHMAQARAELLKKYDYFYKVGRLPEEPESGSALPNTVMNDEKEAWMIVHNEALLFPYKDVEGSAAFDGLREQFEEQPISAAQPVLVDPGQKVEFLRRRMIEYPAAGDREATKVEVVEVKVAQASATSYLTKNRLPKSDLRGWMLADRIEQVSQ